MFFVFRKDKIVSYIIATFFMVGDWVDKYPDAVKKLQKKGRI